MYIFFSFFLDKLSFCIPVLWPFSNSKHCTYISFIYMIMLLSFSPISPCVVSFLSLYTCFLLCVQSFISVSY